MSKMNLLIKGLVAAALLSTTQFAAQAQTLNDVLNRVRQDSQQLSAESRQREAEFRQARDQQAARLSGLRGEVSASEARGRALSAECDSNNARAGALQAQLESEAGDFGELLGQYRQAAGEIMPTIQRSVISAEYPGRAQALSRIAEARRLPDRAELDLLWKTMLLEMVAQSEVKTFNATYVAPDGTVVEDAPVMRIGPFTTFSATSNPIFMEMTSEGKLVAFTIQPTGAIKSGAAKLVSAAEGAVVGAPFDPSRGDLLGILQDVPDLSARIQQGGLPGYVVMVLMVVGILLGAWRLIVLTMVSGAVRKTAQTRQGGDGDPLARVFSVYEKHKSSDIETLEMKLDEQILKETPKLDFGVNIIKVLAAVAPLLGLLGTVVGMIRTFTQITLFGTGDPKLMADGISQALVTTVQGLVAAIPLLLIHAIVSGSSRSVQQVLDEQASGLVAERAEAEGKGRAA